MINFSHVRNLPVHQHSYLDFADVQIGVDNHLFIDPSRIHLAALAGDPWAKDADVLITSFFSALYAAAAQRDFEKVFSLTNGTCGELNETQLGLSHGAPRGNGASSELIFSALKQIIDYGLFENDLIDGLADVPILADRIDADRLSDWTTNIIWPVLRDFTYEQHEKHHLHKAQAPLVMRSFWDTTSSSWRESPVTDLYCSGKRIWLCPKKFLHKQLLMSTGSFLREHVLVYRQTVHLDRQSDLCRQKELKDGTTILMEPYKKDIIASELRGSSRTQYARENTKEYPTLLRNYHRGFEFQPGKSDYFISDEELDEILYPKD